MTPQFKISNQALHQGRIRNETQDALKSKRASQNPGRDSNSQSSQNFYKIKKTESSKTGQKAAGSPSYSTMTTEEKSPLSGPPFSKEHLEAQRVLKVGVKAQH